MDARVVGTECEYALMHSGGRGINMSGLDGDALLAHVKSVTPLLVQSLRLKGYHHAGEFLGNGGRFYIDRGGHPEYATPECSSVRELVAHETAGDRILQELVEQSRELLSQTGGVGRPHVYKNNTDGHGSTYGAHENYLVTPHAMDNIHALIPFLVTRQIYAGAGKVQLQGDDVARYQLSQRAEFINRVFSDRTSQTRGIINLRKREIPKQGQSRRLHIIFSDSNLCHHSIALKVGATALVLTLLEQGRLKNPPVVSSAVESLRNVSASIDAPIALEGRRGTFTALDVQRMYLEQVDRYYGRGSGQDGDREMLRLWSFTLDGLERLRICQDDARLEDDPADLKGRIDWVLKLWLITRTLGKQGPFESGRALKILDLQYHDLDPATGLFRRCEELGLTDRLESEATIKRAMVEPPQGTRAAVRGTVIQMAAQRNVEVFCDNWERILITARSPNTTASSHPFKQVPRIGKSMVLRLDDPFMACESSLIDKVKEFVGLWD